MKNGWQIITFGEILKRVKNEIQIEDELIYKQVTLRLWNRGVILRGVKKGSEIKTKRQFLVRTGQLVLSRIDVRNGAIGLCPPELEGAIVSNDFWVYDFNETIILPKFLAFFVTTPGFLDEANRTSSGTTKRIRAEENAFLRIKIPLPLLDEQRRIVARIEALAERMCEALSLRESADKDTEALLNSFIIKTLREFEITWGTKKFGDICDTTSGGTPSRDNPMFYDGNIPWVKSGELEDNLIFDTEEKITEDGLKSSSAKIFPKGTSLVALYGATVGKTAILEIDATTNQAVCAIFPRDGCLLNKYIQYYFRSKRSELLGNSFGGAQPNISQKMIRDMVIPFPPLDEQRRIVAHLDAVQVKVDELRRLQAEKWEELSALIPSILDRAFKGEL